LRRPIELPEARAATVAVGLHTFFNVVNAAAAYPAGVLADRIGKRGLLAARYAVGAATYTGFIFEQPTIPVMAILFGLASVHGAVQQSLEKSVPAELLPKAVRGSGFGVLRTTNGVGDLVSSIAVAALRRGPRSNPGGADLLIAGDNQRDS
jgi:MFS family permease